MQLFVRCGAPAGTLAVQCGEEESVGTLKLLLQSRSIHVGPPHTQVNVIFHLPPSSDPVMHPDVGRPHSFSLFKYMICGLTLWPFLLLAI